MKCLFEPHSEPIIVKIGNLYFCNYFWTEESFGSGSGSGDGGDVDVDTEGGDDDDDSGSGMGYPTERVVRPDVVVPDSRPPGSPRNDEDNRLHPIPDDTSKTRKNTTSGGSSHSSLNNRISLNRAILSYLLPVVMMWFGGAISELVQWYESPFC